MEEVDKNPVFQGVDADLKFNKPELKINIDRLKASELGVSVGDISQTLQLALSNRPAGLFYQRRKTIPGDRPGSTAMNAMIRPI